MAGEWNQWRRYLGRRLMDAVGRVTWQAASQHQQRWQHYGARRGCVERRARLRLLSALGAGQRSVNQSRAVATTKFSFLELFSSIIL